MSATAIDYDLMPEYRRKAAGDWWIDGTAPPLTRAEALVRLRELARQREDKTPGHVYADDILVRFLRGLGEGEVADAFEAVGKWYD